MGNNDKQCDTSFLPSDKCNERSIRCHDECTYHARAGKHKNQKSKGHELKKRKNRKLIRFSVQLCCHERVPKIASIEHATTTASYEELHARLRDAQHTMQSSLRPIAASLDFAALFEAARNDFTKIVEMKLQVDESLDAGSLCVRGLLGALQVSHPHLVIHCSQ